MSRSLPFADYAAIDAVNQSSLRVIVDKSPLHYQHALRSPRKDTPALRFGRAVDVAAFTPRDYATQFIVTPDIDRRTKDGKAAWAAFLELAGDKTLLTEEEHRRAWDCGEAVRSHRATGPLLATGDPQVTLEWTDAATGVRCKARLDLVNSAIVDLKTSQSTDPRAFGQSVHKYGYHFQAAFYRAGWHAVHGEWLDFLLAVVESGEPHDCAAFAVEGDALQRGNELVRQALDTYARCRDAGRWPGRCEEVQSVQFPRYAMAFDEGPAFEIVDDGEE